MEDCACLRGPGSSRGCQWHQHQQRQGPAETAGADRKPAAPAEKHVEAAAAAGSCAWSGGIASLTPPPSPPPPRCCSLQDLPVEVLVEVFVWVPVTVLPVLAQACTKFHSVLQTDCFWRRRCLVDFGARERHLQRVEAMGGSYRDIYSRLLHPYRKLLGWWQLDTEGHTEVLNVAVDGLSITGWKYPPRRNNLRLDGPTRMKNSFTIRLAESKSVTVECAGGYTGPPSCHLHIQGHRLTRCDHLHRREEAGELRRGKKKGREGPQWASLEAEPPVLYSGPFSQRSCCSPYRRLYLPLGHPDDLIRPGFFRATCSAHSDSLKVVMLSFHGKYARATEVSGYPIYAGRKETLEIHLLHRIPPPDVETLRDFNKLCRLLQDVQEQVVQEQREAEGGPGVRRGRGRQSPAQPDGGESGAAALEGQPAHRFALPVSLGSTDRTYRMCFYGEDIVSLRNSASTPRHFPGIVVLFDENHLGFLSLQLKHFVQYRRYQRPF